MELAAVRKGRDGTTQLAANKRFGKFNPEKEQAVREPNVKGTKVLEKLKEIYQTVMDIGDVTEYRKKVSDLLIEHGLYLLVDSSGIALRATYSSDDIRRFSIVLAEFQDDRYFVKTGTFLSELLRDGGNEDYLIITKHLTAPIHELGYRNRKNITVEGNVGCDLGHWMKSGKIIIQGDASHRVGEGMTGGIIVVKGNAGNAIGRWMEGGEIHIEGQYETISNHIICGRIFHKGKLIVERGHYIR